MGANAHVPVGLNDKPGVPAIGDKPHPAVTTSPGMRLRHWEGETACLAFVPRSNTTHLLTMEAGMLLRAVQEGHFDLGSVDPEIVAGLVSVGFLVPSAAHP